MLFCCFCPMFRRSSLATHRPVTLPPMAGLHMVAAGQQEVTSPRQIFPPPPAEVAGVFQGVRCLTPESPPPDPLSASSSGVYVSFLASGLVRENTQASLGAHEPNPAFSSPAQSEPAKDKRRPPKRNSKRDLAKMASKSVKRANSQSDPFLYRGLKDYFPNR